MAHSIARIGIPRSVYFLLFTISGFAGLIYESIWTHYLKLFLGHAAYAQTLVLIIFMGGMAWGAKICATRTSRWKNLLLGYAIAELIIGFFALIFHSVFVWATDFSYETIFPALGGSAGLSIFKWTLAAVLILPQSILLGMTFPLMSAAILRKYPDTPGSALSMLYFTNSFGAAIGVLASGFFLIERFGMPGTLLTAGILNIALALAVWVTTKLDLHERDLVAVSGNAKLEGVALEPGERRFLNLLLGASLLSGAASFCYEIGWIRMLSLVLGSSTHAFEIMLSAFIMGIAFGGLWIKRRIDAYQNLIAILAIVLVAKGVFALATLPVYGMTFDLMQATMTSLARTEFSYLVFNFISHIISLSVMFPAAFCAGMSLPLITFALLKKGYGESSIGRVYAWNTFGSILGVAFAVHFAMPLLGLKGLIVFAAAIDIGVALFLLARAGQEKSSNAPRVLATVGVAALVGSMVFVQFDSGRLASGVYRTGKIQDSSATKYLFHRDGKTATVDVIESDNVRAILTNGKSDAGISTDEGVRSLDEFTMVLAGAIPLAHKPDAKRVANIGFGSGLTTHTLLGDPNLTVVDTIEIEPSMIEGARLFGAAVERAHSDPRSVIHIDDAKSFFAGQAAKYDIIVSEPSNPWVSGVSGLFSREFYSQVKSHLNDGGIMVQWIQLYEIDVELVASILKALGSQFSDYVIYDTDGFNVVIVAVPKGSVPALSEVPFQWPDMKAQLDTLKVKNVGDLAIRRVGSKKHLQHLVKSYGIPANSDFFPVVDLKASRARLLGASAVELTQLPVAPLPVMEMLEGRQLTWTTTLPPGAFITRAAQRGAFAHHLRNHLLTGSIKASQHLDAETRLKSSYVRDSMFHCVDIENRDLVLDSLFQMAPTLAHLPPQEANQFWQALQASKCYAKLPAINREWIELFRAVGNRDGASMAQKAESLLERKVTAQRQEYEYLLMASMLGRLAGDDAKGALTVWRKYGKKIIESGNISLPFRLLALMAEDVDRVKSGRVR